MAEALDIPRGLTETELLLAERSIRRLMMTRQWSTDTLRWDALTEGDCRRERDASPAVAGDTDPSWWAGDPDWRGRRLGPGFCGFRGRLSREQRRRMKRTQPCWMPAMMHFLTNELIEVVSPTRARGRWYSWEPATVRVAAGSLRAVWIAGTYDGRFVCVDGSWRIASLTFTEVFSTGVDSNWLAEPHVNYGPAHCPHDLSEPRGDGE